MILDSFEDEFLDNDGKPRKLDPQVLRGIYSIGFEKPTYVQRMSIIPMILGRDMIIQSQSGMGKTGAFVIGALNCIDWSQPTVQVIILGPTSTLVTQIGKVVSEIGAHVGQPPQTPDSETRALAPVCDEKSSPMMVSYGGGNRVEQELSLIRKGQIKLITGTLGRIAHIMRSLPIGSTIKLVVIDEADTILEDRFRTEFNEIISRLPRNVQIALFSATMSEEFLTKARQLVRREPPHVEVLLESEQVSLAGIDQYYVDLQNVEGGTLSAESIDQIKLATLCDICEQLSLNKVIVFTNSRRRTEWLGQELRNRNHSVAILHGELSKDEKQNVERKFRQGMVRVLVSSDLLSRGFDVHAIGLVVNFDMPGGHMEIETYIHRVGRTGRYGSRGFAISLIRSSSELEVLQQINVKYGGKIKELPTSFKDLIRLGCG